MEIIGKTRIGNNSCYICKCPYCNKIINIRFDHYRERKRKDCGCLNHNDAKDGKHNKLYDIHQAIKQRCLNPNQKFYSRYGGRGITICDEWLDYKIFKLWALNNGYKKGLDLDRIDNNKGYFPENCRFIRHIDNCNNRNNTIHIILNDKDYTITSLAKEYNLPRSLIESRYHKGKRDEELVKPKQK